MQYGEIMKPIKSTQKLKIICSLVVYDFRASFRYPDTYIVLSLFLLVSSALFFTHALSVAPRYATEVTRIYFCDMGLVALPIALFAAMRSLAVVHESGSDFFWASSNLTTYQIVLTKLISSLLFLVLCFVSSLYLSVLLYLKENIILSHILLGYVGLMLLSLAAISIGLFVSSISKNQMRALTLFLCLLSWLFLTRYFANFVVSPLKDIFVYLCFWDPHFTSFANGKVNLSSLVYFVSLMAIFSVLTRNAIDARRWS